MGFDSGFDSHQAQPTSSSSNSSIFLSRSPDRIPACSMVINGHQWSSTVINGHQRSSMVSMVINGQSWSTMVDVVNVVIRIPASSGSQRNQDPSLHSCTIGDGLVRVDRLVWRLAEEALQQLLYLPS
jgi:hypothetical protein